MSRKERERDIAKLHQRLCARNQRLDRAQANARAYLLGVNPILILGVSMAAGALLHRIGWRSAYSLLTLASGYLTDTADLAPPYND